MAWYRVLPTWNVVFLPLLVVIMVTAAAGLGMWLTAMAIQYRDVKHALSFIVQLMMYATPVVYSATIVPAKWQTIYRPESDGRRHRGISGRPAGHAPDAVGLDRHRQPDGSRAAR